MSCAIQQLTLQVLGNNSTVTARRHVRVVQIPNERLISRQLRLMTWQVSLIVISLVQVIDQVNQRIGDGLQFGAVDELGLIG